MADKRSLRTLPYGVILGVAAGIALGIALKNVAVGIAVGSGLAILLGVAFDRRGRNGS